MKKSAAARLLFLLLEVLNHTLNFQLEIVYRTRYYFLILFDSLKHEEFTLRLSMMHIDVCLCVYSCLLPSFPPCLLPLDLIQEESNAEIHTQAQVKLKAAQISHKRNFCTCKMRRGLGGFR